MFAVVANLNNFVKKRKTNNHNSDILKVDFFCAVETFFLKNLAQDKVEIFH